MTLILPDSRLEAPELLYPGRKPVGPVIADISNPALRGCKAWYPCLGGNLGRDVVGGFDCRNTGSTDVIEKIEDVGVVLESNGNGERFEANTAIVASSSAYAVSVTAHVYWRSNPQTYECLLGESNTNSWTAGWGIMFTGGNFQFWVDSWQNNVAKVTPTYNTWMHLAGVYDGSTVKFYKDGIPGTEDSYSGDLGNTSDDFQLGNTGGYSDPFDGYIMDVKVFDRAITLEEINLDRRNPFAALIPA